MANKQQTVVEWLVKQLYATPEGPTPAQLDKIVKRAKQMEKEQTMQDYSVGYSNGQVDSNRTAEQYYNETFKSE